MLARRRPTSLDRVSALMAIACLSGGVAMLGIGFDAHAMIALAGGLSVVCWVLAGAALIARGLRR